MRVTVIDTAYRNAIRQRLQDCLNATVARETAQRMRQAEEDQHNALLRRAIELEMTLEPDTVKPGHFVTRSESSGLGINVTSATRCTCREWKIWHRCPCVALVVDHITFEIVLASRQNERTAA